MSVPVALWLAATAAKYGLSGGTGLAENRQEKARRRSIGQRAGLDAAKELAQNWF